MIMSGTASQDGNLAQLSKVSKEKTTHEKKPHQVRKPFLEWKFLNSYMKTKPINVSVGLRQSCVLSSFMFIIYMDKIDRNSSSSSDVTFVKCNVRSMQFINDLALLSSNKSDLQYALDRFPDACLDTTSKSSQ